MDVLKIFLDKIGFTFFEVGAWRFIPAVEEDIFLMGHEPLMVKQLWYLL